MVDSCAKTSRVKDKKKWKTKIKLVFPKKEKIRKKYPKGVVVDANKYADFTPYAIKSVKIENMQGEYYYDYKAANLKAGFGNTHKPPKINGIKYTWHHHEDKETMQLVPTDLHRSISHKGGCHEINKEAK